MKILICDDSYYRHIKFNKKYAGHKVYHAGTVDECIARLSRGGFDILQLDHDLIAQSPCKSDEYSGAEVARWIWRNPGHVKKVIVHSTNPEGAKEIVKYLMLTENLIYTLEPYK